MFEICVNAPLSLYCYYESWKKENVWFLLWCITSSSYVSYLCFCCFLLFILWTVLSYLKGKSLEHWRAQLMFYLPFYFSVSTLPELCEGCGWLRWPSSQCFSRDPSRKQNCKRTTTFCAYINNSFHMIKMNDVLIIIWVFLIMLLYSNNIVIR